MADPNNTYDRPAAPELSMSEEAKYKKKCRDLKRRIGEIEVTNENLVTKLARTNRFIQRARLERAFLLEKLEENAPRYAPGSDGSPSPPPSPSLETFDANASMIEVAPSPDATRLSISPPPRETPHEHRSHGGVHHSSAAHTPAGKDRGSPAPKEGKKAKPPKDPNAPKRPKNAFLLFCELERDRVRASADTGLGETVDIARELGRVWAEMNDEARKPYRDLYENDKIRYEKQMTKYEGAKKESSSLQAIKREEGGTKSSSTKPAASGWTPANAKSIAH